MVFFSYDFTSVSHGVLLASLANYFISLRRTFASGRAKVELEIVGQVMITIGIVMVLADSGTMDTLQSDNRYHFKLTKFLSKPVWQRIILGDCVCLLAGFCISRISAIDQQVKSIFPPYLGIFFI
jgi:drug/metabolite transporter (DMT)-like permease